MDKYTMFMDQKNQYSDKELYYTKQSIDSCYQQYFSQN